MKMNILCHFLVIFLNVQRFSLSIFHVLLFICCVRIGEVNKNEIRIFYELNEEFLLMRKLNHWIFQI